MSNTGSTSFASLASSQVLQVLKVLPFLQVLQVLQILQDSRVFLIVHLRIDFDLFLEEAIQSVMQKEFSCKELKETFVENSVLTVLTKKKYTPPQSYT